MGMNGQIPTPIAIASEIESLIESGREKLHELDAGVAHANVGRQSAGGSSVGRQSAGGLNVGRQSTGG